MRLLGIDYGTKKIGLALTDLGGRFSAPYEVIPTNGDNVNYVTSVCQKEGVGKIVIGKSFNYDGQPNPVWTKTEKFAADLKEKSGLAVEFVSEILTTKEAERDIGKDALTDARAAALILKSYIDQQKNNGNR